MLPGDSVVQNPLAYTGDTGDMIWSLGQKDPLEEEEWGTHSSILAWKIPWTEEPSRLQSLGLQSHSQLNTHFTWYFFFPCCFHNSLCFWFLRAWLWLVSVKISLVYIHLSIFEHHVPGWPSLSPDLCWCLCIWRCSHLFQRFWASFSGERPSSKGDCKNASWTGCYAFGSWQGTVV